MSAAKPVTRANPLLAAIRRDHERIRSLLERLSATGPRARRARSRLLARLAELLDSHATAEESVLYRAMLLAAPPADRARAQVLEGVEEHHVADTVLCELLQLDVSDERWSAKAEVLREMLAHHLREEEEELFGRAERLIAADLFAPMARRFRALRRGVAAVPTAPLWSRPELGIAPLRTGSPTRPRTPAASSSRLASGSP